MKKLNVTKDQETLARTLYKTGLNRKEVADNIGISEWAVRKILKNQFRTRNEWSVFSYKKKEDKLTNKQFQCILGTLLGDASLSYRKGTWEYQVSHCLDQKTYCDHIASVLNRTVKEYTKNNSFSDGSKYFRVNYGNKAALEKIAKIVLTDTKKTVTKEWVDLIDEVGIAYWFMDDGTSSYKPRSVKVSFSTLAFDTEELSLLQSKLKYFGIDTYLSKHSLRSSGEQQYTIDLFNRSVNDFWDLIQPHLLDCFAYKVKRQ